MQESLAQKAVLLALKGNWQDAAETNKAILITSKDDIDALNRLARCYAEMGMFNKAKSISKQVLALDPYNKIADKCLNRWKALSNGIAIEKGHTTTTTFIEEPGKTRIVNLSNLGSADILVALDAGDEVLINASGLRISISTLNGHYIGKIPDDIGIRLRKLIKGGNIYQAVIKSAHVKEVKVFLKEVKCAKDLVNVTSFPTEKIDYVAYTPPELVHNKKEIIEQIEEIEA